MSEVNPLRREILVELEFLQSMGGKIFLCPFIGRTRIKMIGYYITYVLVICTAIQLTLTLFLNGTNDWLEIINVAPNLGVVMMTLIKYTKIHTNREVYNDLYNHFRYDIWNIIDVQSVEHKKIVKQYKMITMAINRFLLYYSTPLIIVVDSFPYLVMVYEEKYKGITEALYPFDGWYPFDKIKWYTAAYIWESCMTAVVVCVHGFSNMMHSSYIGFICMELRILGDCLQNIIGPVDAIKINKKCNIDSIHKSVNNRLRMLIARHDFLAKKSAKLDAILGYAMLLNYFLGAVFICLTAFTFTVVDNLYKSIRYFFMSASLLIDVFSQCLIGQILSDHSENLTNAVYSCDWTNASPRDKRIMLMFMVRTQKPFQLRANGYVAMNMNTFSSICSTSYQLFNLLRTMFSK